MSFIHVDIDSKMGSFGSPFSGAFDRFVSRAERAALLASANGNVRGPNADAKDGADPMARFFANVWREDTLRAINADREVNRNADSASPNGGAFLADQLTHIYNEVLREEHPVPNGLRLFPVDSSVPVGKRSHRVTRLWQDGEARVYRAGEEIPRAGFSKVTQDFNVAYYITSIMYDMFEEMAAGVANVALIRELTLSAREALEAFANQKVWNGDEASGLYGIFNYPWLPKKVLATAFTDASWTSNGGQAILDELLAFVEIAGEQSKGLFRPTHLAVTQRVMNYLNAKPVGTTSAIRDFTIMEKFKAAHPEITIEVGIWELENAGGTNVDGIFAYRKDRQGVSNVLVGGMQSLPLQVNGFDRMQPFFMGHGGVIMRSVGNNILGFVAVDG